MAFIVVYNRRYPKQLSKGYAASGNLPYRKHKKPTRIVARFMSVRLMCRFKRRLKDKSKRNELRKVILSHQALWPSHGETNSFHRRVLLIRSNKRNKPLNSAV